MLVGAVSIVTTALTGLVDWLSITRGTELWKTATSHAIAMVTATLFFLVALLTGHDDFKAGDLSTLPFLLTVIGFCCLTLGGWLGGSIVFVHGMRVLGLEDEP